MLQRGFGSIMHERGASICVAQSRRFKGVLHRGNLRQQLAAANVIAFEADVVETIISKTPARMALGTIGLRVEHYKAPLGLFGDRVFVAFEPFIKRGVG